jgi:hypothetical protein
MLTSQRKQLILEKLGAEGQVLSRELSLHFDVSKIPSAATCASWRQKGACNVFTVAHCHLPPRLRRLLNVRH